MVKDVLDLRNAARDGDGKIDPHGTYRDSKGSVTSRAVSLSEPSTLEKIFILVRDANGAWLTRAEIAKAVNLKKSPYLHNLIEQLVRDGWIERYVGQSASRNMAQYWYRLPDVGAAQ